MTKLEINSAEDMQKLGASLAKAAKPHDLLLLNGDLGAGKTTMTQGLGRELGIHRPVKSPTFTIVREYREAKMPLFHMDFYRLENDDLSSIIGIDLATLYRQDFLNLNFDKIIPLIDQYEIYLNEENTFLFLSFMEDVIKETKRYLIEANERLFKDGKCISRIYLNNYEQSLKDIITLINYFKDAITICSEEEKNIFYQDHNMDDELNALEGKIKSLQEIHHEVLENEESLDDNRIIVVNTKGLKTYRYAMGFEIVMAIIMIVFLLLGVFLKNNLFYYLILIPLGLGVIGYLIYYFVFLKNK